MNTQKIEARAVQLNGVSNKLDDAVNALKAYRNSLYTDPIGGDLTVEQRQAIIQEVNQAITYIWAAEGHVGTAKDNSVK